MLCQYNNIYGGSYKYLKEKKVHTKEWEKMAHYIGHCRWIASFYIFSRKKEHKSMIGGKKKYILNKSKTL